MVGILKLLVKVICFIIFCLCSGFTLMLGKTDSNIKIYYVFTAICLAGVVLLW